MSTFSPFLAAPVEILPALACIGTVETVKDGKQCAAPSIYAMVSMSLSPNESGKKAFVNFMFHPSWLESGYDPKELGQYENAKGLRFTYRKNICGSSDLSILAGISGSEENFHQLAGKLQALEEKTPENVSEVIREFVNENNSEVGYILTQKQAKNEETGKYEPADGYEVGEWFYPTDENKRKLAKRAANGKLSLTFEI